MDTTVIHRVKYLTVTIHNLYYYQETGREGSAQSVTRKARTALGHQHASYAGGKSMSSGFCHMWGCILQQDKAIS
jgi:hypothetical protein